MSKLSIGTAWDQTREVIGRDGKQMMAIALATIMLPMALTTMLNPGSASGQPAEPSFGIMLLALIMNLVMMTGSLSLTAIALNKGKTVAEALKLGVSKLLPVIGASLLIGIPVAIVCSIVFGPELLSALANGDQAAATALLTPQKAMLFLALLIVMLLVGIKLMVMTPVAVAETNNPVTMITRSWNLTKGHYARLLGYILLIVVASMVVAFGGVLVVGVIIMLIFGAPGPMSLSALFFGLALGAIYAVMIAIIATMTARIYAQLVADPGVPDVKAG